jgi:hypothetical protein
MQRFVKAASIIVTVDRVHTFWCALVPFAFLLPHRRSPERNAVRLNYSPTGNQRQPSRAFFDENFVSTNASGKRRGITLQKHERDATDENARHN